MSETKFLPIVQPQNNTVFEALSGVIQHGCDLDIAIDRFSLYAFDALKNKLREVTKLRLLYAHPCFDAAFIDDTALLGSFAERPKAKALTQAILARDFATFLQAKSQIKACNTLNPGVKRLDIRHNGTLKATIPNSPDFTCDGLGLISPQMYSGMMLCDEMAQSMDGVFEATWNSPQGHDIRDNMLAYLHEIYCDRCPAEIYQKSIYEIFKSQDITANVRQNTRIEDSQIYKKLYQFQRDAMYGIIDKIEKHNGCILADSVGLGKTFTALSVIKYYELRNDRVLVLAPKKLGENWLQYKANERTNPFTKDKFNYDVLYHTDLTRESGYSNNINLATVNYDNYDLLVIDESHNFRTDSSEKDNLTRYKRILNDICRNGVKTKVLLLSATPVNNRIKDLASQLKFITLGDDAAFAGEGIVSLDDLTASAQRKFNAWSKLPENERTVDRFAIDMDPGYFKLLDTISIARSRKHIENNYDITDLGKFPQRCKPINIIPEALRTDRRILIQEINSLVADQLSLTVLAPLNALKLEAEPKYREQLEEKSNFSDRGREGTTMKLILSMLLKRLESSVDSFRETVQLFRNKTADAIKKLERIQQIDQYTSGFDGFDPEDDSFAGLIEGFDDGDFDGFIQGRKKKIHVDILDIDARKWLPALKEDLEILDQILTIVHDCSPENDEKLRRLYEDCLVPKWQPSHTIKERRLKGIEQPHIARRRLDAPVNLPNADGQWNKKVIIFTAYTDTAKYLYHALKDKILNEYGLYTALVTGSVVQSNLEVPKEIAKKLPTNRFDSVLTHFSPISKNRDAIIHANYSPFPLAQRERGEGVACESKPGERGEVRIPQIDVLIATDCISEGQNLQDCDYLINYDVHWNPVRLIQRFGRIDRIGSTNENIQLVTFWPTDDLDEYLKLSQRVKARNVLANITGGGGVTPTDEKNDELTDALDYRNAQTKKQLDSIKNNRNVQLENINGNISITDLTFQDYRADLMRIQGSHAQKLARLPNAVCAVCECSDNYSIPGAFFLIQSDASNIDTSNPLFPYYPVFISMDGTITESYKNSQKALQILRSACANDYHIDTTLMGKFAIQTRTAEDVKPYADLYQKALDYIQGIKTETGQASLFRKGGTAFRDAKDDDYTLICAIYFKERAAQ